MNESCIFCYYHDMFKIMSDRNKLFNSANFCILALVKIFMLY